MDTRALTCTDCRRRLSALGTGKEELARFERRLAEHLAADANIAIRGNRLAHESTTSACASRTGRATFLPARHPRPGPESPTVFRRETPFRSDLLGNSVPAWAIGAAPAESFGPFADEHGLPVWFDIFLPAPLVSVTFSGATAPALRARVRRTLTNAVCLPPRTGQHLDCLVLDCERHRSSRASTPAFASQAARSISRRPQPCQATR